MHDKTFQWQSSDHCQLKKVLKKKILDKYHWAVIEMSCYTCIFSRGKSQDFINLYSYIYIYLFLLLFILDIESSRISFKNTDQQTHNKSLFDRC